MPPATCARGNSPRANAAARSDGSPGNTSTTGVCCWSELNAHGDGSRLSGRQPSARNGSYTPLTAYRRASSSGRANGVNTVIVVPSTTTSTGMGAARSTTPSASASHAQAPSPVTRIATCHPVPSGIASPEPGSNASAPPSALST